MNHSKQFTFDTSLITSMTELHQQKGDRHVVYVTLPVTYITLIAFNYVYECFYTCICMGRMASRNSFQGLKYPFSRMRVWLWILSQVSMSFTMSRAIWVDSSISRTHCMLLLVSWLAMWLVRRRSPRHMVLRGVRIS